MRRSKASSRVSEARDVRCRVAKSYVPFLHVEHAELAGLIGDETARQRELGEAHRLFLEIGAPIRAEQVAKGLGL
jgi:hypothetical protein